MKICRGDGILKKYDKMGLFILFLGTNKFLWIISTSNYKVGFIKVQKRFKKVVNLFFVTQVNSLLDVGGWYSHLRQYRYFDILYCKLALIDIKTHTLTNLCDSLNACMDPKG